MPSFVPIRSIVILVAVAVAVAAAAAGCTNVPAGDSGASGDAGAGGPLPLPPGGGPPSTSPNGPPATDDGASAVPGCVPIAETCDGTDNDCDGQVDEIGCACTTDTSCFAGPASARGVGTCRDGVRACDDRGEQFLACQGSIGPVAETCNGTDDDCDGETDEIGCCNGAPCPDAGLPAPMPDAGPGPGPDPGPCEPGDVTGLVCAPDGSPVGGARVFVDTTDCGGAPRRVEAVTDATGHYRLDGLAPGPALVIVQAGQFRQENAVVVVAGQVTDASAGGAAECLGRTAARLAVTTGDYDRIEDIVSRLGFETDVYCGDEGETYGARALFGDWERLSGYDVVFVNCGLGLSFASPEGARMAANLQRFVAEGGSLYVSDLAAHLIDAVWPGRVDFAADSDPAPEDDPCCTCVDCPPECGAQPEARGPGGACMGTAPGGQCWNAPPFLGYGFPGERAATVRDPALVQALGRAQLTVDYDSPDWVEIARLAPGVEVLVESAGEPLMVRFGEPGGGRVTYTTFHNEAQAGADVTAILRALVFQL
jgi:hypothetical protein